MPDLAVHSQPMVTNDKSVAPAWILVDIFIHVNDEDESETMKTDVETSLVCQWCEEVFWWIR